MELEFFIFPDITSTAVIQMDIKGRGKAVCRNGEV